MLHHWSTELKASYKDTGVENLCASESLGMILLWRQGTRFKKMCLVLTGQSEAGLVVQYETYRARYAREYDETGWLFRTFAYTHNLFAFFWWFKVGNEIS